MVRGLKRALLEEVSRRVTEANITRSSGGGTEGRRARAEKRRERTGKRKRQREAGKEAKGRTGKDGKGRRAM